MNGLEKYFSSKQIVTETPEQAGMDFMALMEEANVQSHIWHLQTELYSQHKALNMVYDTLPDLLDAVLEAYQGKHGVRIKGNIQLNLQGEYNDSKVAEYFKNFKMKLSEIYHSEHFNYPCLQNPFEDILTFCDKINYLLSLRN